MVPHVGTNLKIDHSSLALHVKLRPYQAKSNINNIKPTKANMRSH